MSSVNRRNAMFEMVGFCIVNMEADQPNLLDFHHLGSFCLLMEDCNAIKACATIRILRHLEVNWIHESMSSQKVDNGISANIGIFGA